MQMRHNYDLCEGCRGLDDAEASGPYEQIGPVIKVCHHPCAFGIEHAAHTAAPRSASSGIGDPVEHVKMGLIKLFGVPTS